VAVGVERQPDLAVAQHVHHRPMAVLWPPAACRPCLGARRRLRQWLPAGGALPAPAPRDGHRPHSVSGRDIGATDTTRYRGAAVPAGMTARSGMHTPAARLHTRLHTRT
jgi:hypothetical protein